MVIRREWQALSRRGFTLIEVLVVVAIIALLISVLLPSLQRARDQAKSLACLSNLKQIGTTMSYYSSDNGMKFLPPFRYVRRINSNTNDGNNVPGWWQYLTYKYLFNNTKVTECPKDDFVESSRPQFKRGPYRDLKGNSATIYYSYAINAVLPKQTQPITKNANDILPDYYAPTGTPEFTWYIRERYNPPVLSAIKRPADTVFMLETREGGMLNGRELHTF